MKTIRHAHLRKRNGKVCRVKTHRMNSKRRKTQELSKCWSCKKLGNPDISDCGHCDSYSNYEPYTSRKAIKLTTGQVLNNSKDIEKYNKIRDKVRKELSFMKDEDESERQIEIAEKRMENLPYEDEEEPYDTSKRSKTLKFKSEEDYKKWLAYGHIHGAFKKPGHQKITIAGKAHKVKH